MTKRGKRKAKRKKRKNKAWIIMLVIIIFVIIITNILILVSRNMTNFGRANVVLIHIDNVILTTQSQSFFPYAATYSDDIVDYIKKTNKNKNIKAIIFEINSPGGSSVASSEIADAIEEVEKDKTTVAVIRETGASGAYWIASSCDYVIAHPLSITGSIGVIASYLEISRLLEQYNVTYERFVSGEYKDTMSPYRELSDKERELIQKKIDLIYEVFVEEVAENRNLTEEQVKELANGMFYLGKEAKDLGLVDELGSTEDAIAYVEKKHDIKAKIKEYKKERGLFDRFGLFSSKSFFWIGRGIGASLVDQGLVSTLEIRT